MKVPTHDLPWPTFQELEDSTQVEPSFNIGQRVIWLDGIKHSRGDVVMVTKVKFDGYKWWLETDGDGTVFPGRVMAYYNPEGGESQ